VTSPRVGTGDGVHMAVDHCDPHTIPRYDSRLREVNMFSVDLWEAAGVTHSLVARLTDGPTGRLDWIDGARS
jgi:hypothetical protein